MYLACDLGVDLIVVGLSRGGEFGGGGFEKRCWVRW